MKTSDNVILLKKGSSFEKNAFFIHDGAGDVYIYTFLCSFMDDSYNCWGLISNICGIGPVNTTVEDIARPMMDGIRLICNGNPAVIVGWSIGGLIAVEVCRQLENIGVEVRQLVVLDTFKSGRISAKLIYDFDFERESIVSWFNTSSIKELLSGANDFEEMYNILIESRSESFLELAKKKFHPNVLHAIPEYYMSDIKNFIMCANKSRTFWASSENYILPAVPLENPLLFIKAQKSQYNIKDNQLLSCFLNSLYEEVPFDHYSMMHMVNVSDVSKLINEQLQINCGF